MILILLSISCSIVICADQFIRYWKDPIVISLECDYHNWLYRPVAVTYCSDNIDEDVIEKVLIDKICGNYGRSCGRKQDKQLIRIIGRANISNLHLFEEYDQFFLRLTGIDLYEIAGRVEFIAS